MVESLPSKQVVAGSSPVSRSTKPGDFLPNEVLDRDFSQSAVSEGPKKIGGESLTHPQTVA